MSEVAKVLQNAQTRVRDAQKSFKNATTTRDSTTATKDARTTARALQAAWDKALKEDKLAFDDILKPLKAR